MPVTTNIIPAIWYQGKIPPNIMVKKRTKLKSIPVKLTTLFQEKKVNIYAKILTYATIATMIIATIEKTGNI